MTDKTFKTEYEAKSAAIAAAIEEGGEVWAHRNLIGLVGLEGFEHDLESEDEYGNPACPCNPTRIW